MVNCDTIRALDIKLGAELYPVHMERALIVGESNIKWDAELHPRHVEGSLVAGEPEADSYADAPTVVDLVDSSSSNSSTCCILRYFRLRNRHNNGNGKGY